MERVEIITVERTSCLSSDIHPERCVLIVEPRLSVPPDGWMEQTETVAVLRPDGREFEATAQISLSHLNIKMEDRDLSIDQRWRVSLLFHGLTSDDVPDGSKIFVSHETRDALLPKTVA
jgi:hypothetical protein